MKASQVSLFVIALGMVLGSNAYADSRVKPKYMLWFCETLTRNDGDFND